MKKKFILFLLLSCIIIHLAYGMEKTEMDLLTDKLRDAVMDQNYKVVLSLVECKADPFRETENGEAPYFVAQFYCDPSAKSENIIDLFKSKFGSQCNHYEQNCGE
jgi:hypothetical protein